MVGSLGFPSTSFGKIGTFLLLSRVELLGEGLNECFWKRKPFSFIRIRDHTKFGLLLGQVRKFILGKRDFKHVMEMKEFEQLVIIGSVAKPITILSCDGGPDENPRLPKTLDVSVQHSKRLGWHWQKFLVKFLLITELRWTHFQSTRPGLLKTQYISPYFLHIVQCTKWESYGVFRISCLRLFLNRFLPASIPLRQLCEGALVPSVQDTKPTDCFLGLLPLFIHGKLGASKIDCRDKIWKRLCLFTFSSGK